MSVIRVHKITGTPEYAIGANYFSKAIVEHSKAVPGMRFEKILKPDGGPILSNVWVGYPDAVAAVVARLAVKGITVFGTEALPEPESWRTSRSPYLFSTKGLREYQVDGVRFLLARCQEGALLADGMRLGKSCQTTVAARALKTKTIIVCPSHVVGVWGRPPEAVEGPGEIAKWWPDAWKANPESGQRGVVCLETVKPAAAQTERRALIKKRADLEKHDKELSDKEKARLKELQADLITRAAVLKDVQVIVCHYDILYAWTDVLIEWGAELLVLDEGHIVSGYQSRRSDELKTLRDFVPRCIVLTGTPVTSMPKNFHNVLTILSPGRFGYFFAPNRDGCYARLYCDSKQKTVGKGENQLTVWDHTGRSNLDEPDGKYALTQEETLRARVKYFTLRRVKKDVDPQLPTKQRQIIDVTIPPRACIQVTHNHLSGDPKELRRILDLAADAKLPTVIEMAVGHVNEQEKIIVACHRRQFTEVVCDKITNKVENNALVEFVHGGLSQRERDERIHALRTHDGPGALVATIDTISTGIDLSYAAAMIVAELIWEFHELEQLEERLYAFGKEMKSIIKYVIARGTGDELILRGIINKLDSASRLGLSAKDSMKVDLETRKGNAMKRLGDALLEMQKAQEPRTGTRKRK